VLFLWHSAPTARGNHGGLVVCIVLRHGKCNGLTFAVVFMAARFRAGKIMTELVHCFWRLEQIITTELAHFIPWRLTQTPQWTHAFFNGCMAATRENFSAVVAS
jgi:hypothetical protein